MNERSEQLRHCSFHFISSSYGCNIIFVRWKSWIVDTGTLKNAELSTKLQNTLYYGEFLVIEDTESMIVIILDRR